MAQVKIIRGGLANIVEAIRRPQFLLRPAWQADNAMVSGAGQRQRLAAAVLLFYAAGTAPSLEREILRDFRGILTAEFIPPALVPGSVYGSFSRASKRPPDAHSGLAGQSPGRPVFCRRKHGGGQARQKFGFSIPGRSMRAPPRHRPRTDYGLGISPPNMSWSFPIRMPCCFREAENPMAFRPYRNIRPYGVQDVYWTVHGSYQDPIETQTRLPGRRNASSVSADHGEQEAILKELYEINVTRVSLFPGLTNIVRTLGYRYSKDYVTTEI